jgi:Ti-type conjugative transfer relaxase TraA
VAKVHAVRGELRKKKMAIYHFSGQVISRSQGRSSVAAAAYRSAERIQDLETGLTHDFTKKEHDILYKEILLPDGAPERLKDRSTLWNEVEKGEKRKDAQLCREFNISLPRELTTEQNKTLIREFVQQEFVDKGMIADVCMHQGKAKDGEEQPHVHVMLTMREVTPDGFGKKVREWNNKDLLLTWRERWAEVANRHLFLAGHDMKIDHRSFEAQGINLEPQNKIGPVAAQEKMARFEEHQKIARENGARILANPQLALDAMTRQQSTFTHHDLARFINRHSADREQFTQVYETVKAQKEVVFLGIDEKGRDRFTTQEMLDLEKKMVSIALEKAEDHIHLVDVATREKVLARSTLTEEQAIAYKHITGGADIACVTGFAGTGKSYMLGVAREAWEKQGFEVHGMTLSGKAAENLQASSGIESHTVASRLNSWDKGYARLTSRDIVVIDEAGMLGSKQMTRVLEEVDKANAKIVLIGDPEQLQAIQAGAAYRAISERIGYVELRDIRRQKEEWQKEATINFATGRTTEGLLAYEERDHMHGYNTQPEAMDGMIERWDETRTNNPEKSLIMLAYTRADVKELNERARDIRREYGELGEGSIIQTENGKREFAKGDRVYFLQNEYQDLDVKNGTLGTIENIHDSKLQVRLDAEDNEKARVVSFDTKHYDHLDYGYAATIHKAQGATVDRSFTCISKYMDRHATYVAMSRHRDGAEIFWSRDEFPDFKSMAQSIGRERIKEVSLDYANAHGLEISEELTQKLYQRDLSSMSWDEFKETMKKDAGKTDHGFLREEVHSERDSLAQFKSEFEKNNKELAEKIKQDISKPVGFEKEALEAENHYKELNKELTKTAFPNAVKQEIKEHSYNISKQPEVMNFIKQHNQGMAKEMQKLAKEHAKTLERSRGLELSIGGR